MKKLLLLVLAVLTMTFMANAQEATIYEFEADLQDWTNIDADGDGHEWYSLNPTNNPNNIPGHNGSLGHVTSASYSSTALFPDNYFVSPVKAAYSSITFYACAQDASWPDEHFGVAVSTTDNTQASAFTTIQEWTMTSKRSGVMSTGRDGQMRDQGTWYEYTVTFGAYAGQDIWVAIRHFNTSDMFRINIDDVTLTVGGSTTVTINEIYLNGYTAPAWGGHPDFDLTVGSGANYTIHDVFWYYVNGDNSLDLGPESVFDSEEGVYYMEVQLEPAAGYVFDSDAIVYFDGSNAVHDPSQNYFIGDNLGVYTIDYHLTAPLPGTYDFENSTLQGWTTIDADGDGYNWVLGSDMMGTGYGHNASTDCVLSQSYDNNAGTLTPDNYLVSPTKAAYRQISFWACAQDNLWAAEHFGVAVSTDGNTDATDFTTIQEWTMTAKDQGAWYEYSVDLSSYEGQEIWVAIRHFNSTDMFYIDVDDIVLSESDAVSEHDVNMLSVYPNPATDKVVVTSEVSVNRYDIYNVAGDVVMSNQVDATEFNVNVSELASGAYIIRIYGEGLIQTKRFVVK